MLIDTEHLHFWMSAIRQSHNPIRTLDAFWKGQIKSKEWLIQELIQIVNLREVTIEIHGGWVGVLASLLFQSKMNITYIKSLDKDQSCKKISELMNHLEFEHGKFESITCNMCEFTPDSDIIINTSVEHLEENEFEFWFRKIPKTSLIVLQSNNLFIDEHVRPANNIKEFQEQAKLLNLLYQGELELPNYTRFMLIGYKK